ncbi:MAG: ABC transporter permease [Moorellales bacterium]
MTYAAPAMFSGVWASACRFLAGTLAIAELEARKLRNDPAEVVTRAVQPLLWLAIFGQVFGRLRGLPTGGVSYLEYLTPGILSQSVVFISIFFGISVLWERDAGIFQKLLVAPVPRAAFVLGKGLSASLRALIQGVIIMVIAALLGVRFRWGAAPLLGALLTVTAGACVFSSLSMLLACWMRTRERFMGIGQVITMPLFFASNALYPVELMPPWLRVIAFGNPMSYIVEALRAFLLGLPGSVARDLGLLAAFALVLILLSARQLHRLV